MAQRDIPLELERKFFVLSRSFVLGTHEDIVEQEKVPQLSAPFRDLDDKRVFHQMALMAFLMGKQLALMLHVVLVQERLNRLESLIQRFVIGMILGSVLDEVLEAQ